MLEKRELEEGQQYNGNWGGPTRKGVWDELKVQTKPAIQRASPGAGYQKVKCVMGPCYFSQQGPCLLLLPLFSCAILPWHTLGRGRVASQGVLTSSSKEKDMGPKKRCRTLSRSSPSTLMRKLLGSSSFIPKISLVPIVSNFDSSAFLQKLWASWSPVKCSFCSS